MSIPDNIYTLPEVRPDYFAFTKEHAKKINVEKREAYEYISPNVLNMVIRDYAMKVNLNWFEAVLINKEGGLPFAHDLLKWVGFPKRIEHIGYHENGTITGKVPKDLTNSRVLIIDDILDQGITGNMINQDAHGGQLLYLLSKRGVQRQNLSNSTHLIEIDDVWVLGKGMNGDTPGDGYPKDWGRNYDGIAVKIQL